MTHGISPLRFTQYDVLWELNRSITSYRGSFGDLEDPAGGSVQWMPTHRVCLTHFLFLCTLNRRRHLAHSYDRLLLLSLVVDLSRRTKSTDVWLVKVIRAFIYRSPSSRLQLQKLPKIRWELGRFLWTIFHWSSSRLLHYLTATQYTIPLAKKFIWKDGVIITLA